MDKLKPVKSSMIKAYQYDSNTKLLSVVFSNGTEKEYKDVPPDVMSKVFDTAQSIGGAFHKFIAKRYKGSDPTE